VANPGEGMKISLVHAPADREFVAMVAEGLRGQGAEVVHPPGQVPADGESGTAKALRVDRSVQTNELAVGTDPLFEEKARRYLRKLKEPEPLEMEARVFLSYASEDAEAVRKFRGELSSVGVRTFLDQCRLRSSGIPAGVDWRESILSALSRCCAMALFLSPQSIRSAIVAYELGFFLERMQVRAGVFLGVVLLHETEADDLRQLGIPAIEFYTVGAKSAAAAFAREMVAFYTNSQVSCG
jgi:TIR domain